eukprot:1159575-Pelagomonas_calceolata.AAC.2
MAGSLPKDSSQLPQKLDCGWLAQSEWCINTKAIHLACSKALLVHESRQQCMKAGSVAPCWCAGFLLLRGHALKTPEAG